MSEVRCLCKNCSVEIWIDTEDFLCGECKEADPKDSRLAEMEGEVRRLKGENALFKSQHETTMNHLNDFLSGETYTRALRRAEDAESRLALADKLLRGALENIVNAKRFSRDHFRDDTEFANWVRSRSRAALSAYRKG